MTGRQQTKVVGWTEVWSITPTAPGFKCEGVVALVAPKRSSRKALPARKPRKTQP